MGPTQSSHDPHQVVPRVVRLFPQPVLSYPRPTHPTFLPLPCEAQGPHPVPIPANTPLPAARPRWPGSSKARTRTSLGLGTARGLPSRLSPDPVRAAFPLTSCCICGRPRKPRHSTLAHIMPSELRACKCHSVICVSAASETLQTKSSSTTLGSSHSALSLAVRKVSESGSSS